MGEEDMIHIQNGILFDHEKEGDPAISNHLDGLRSHIICSVK